MLLRAVVVTSGRGWYSLACAARCAGRTLQPSPPFHHVHPSRRLCPSSCGPAAGATARFGRRSLATTAEHAPESSEDEEEKILEEVEWSGVHRKGAKLERSEHVSGEKLFEDGFRYVDSWITGVLEGKGIHRPTEVQAQAFAALLKAPRKHDLIINSKTGSGKTLAFLVPLLQSVDTRNPELQAVIVTPTVDLAKQIERVCQPFCKSKGAKRREFPLFVQSFSGAVNARFEESLHKAERPVHVAVMAAPVMAGLMTSGLMRFTKLKYLVIDEIDAVKGVHAAAAHTILETLRPRGQRAHWQDEVRSKLRLIVASATVTPGVVEHLIEHNMRNVVHIHPSDDMQIPSTLQHFMVPARDKYHANRLVARLVEADRSGLNALCFAHHRDVIAEVRSLLVGRDVTCHTLDKHSPRENIAARSAMDHQTLKPRVLICTDVLARGMDFQAVGSVINATVPAHELQYLHRAGRAGRLSRRGRQPGLVFSVVREDAYERYVTIMKVLGVPFAPVTVEGGSLVDVRFPGDPYQPFYQGRKVLGGRKWSPLHSCHTSWLNEHIIAPRRRLASQKPRTPTSYVVRNQFVSYPGGGNVLPWR